ncbi:MAG: glycoside hydrolase family 15 protein [Phycisphaeraceae bacterium]|nr:glycoside hydrolase family 15 protein [Phycisphaeraceae bacterium]
MPRDIPVGNGELLVTFDHLYRVRDIYYPHVGLTNHTAGHIQRFGVWADGTFAWIEHPSWRRELRYRSDTLVTDVRLVNSDLGVELICADAVDYDSPVYMRRVIVRDLVGKPRDVRLFFHLDLSVNGTAVGDTANYDPSTSGVVIYKEASYFLFNACDQHKCGIDHWAIGTKRVGGAEGTWRDAEDGQLGRNAITQGSVDATVGCDLKVPAGGQACVHTWIACGQSHDDVRTLNERIHDRGPERMLAQTEAYWRLWCRKERRDTACLPEPVSDLFYRSQLIVRSQIDAGGAIVAANDSDITHFAGDHYSYCWMRDGALVASALIETGQSELSRSFFRFAGQCIGDKGYFLHKYTTTGHLASSWHPWMIDGQRVLPIQQDETALVLWALRKHFEAFRDVEFIKPLYRGLVTRPADWLLEYRDHNGLPRPSWDLWEERRGVHTWTCAATVGALRSAAAFATDFGEPDRAAAYLEGAERMKGAIRRHLWHKELKRFARLAQPLEDGTYRLDMTHDSANAALFMFDAFEPSDERVMAEMRALMERLWIKTDVGGCARYERDYYHQIERDNIERVPGNPWVICTLWQAQHLIATARNPEDLRRALPMLEWTVARAGPSGVLAEQFHPHTGDPVSVSPLTWSHSTFVSTCAQYMARHAALMGERQARLKSAPRDAEV